MEEHLGWKREDVASVHVEGDGELCGPRVYVVLPGGEALPCFHHLDPLVNRRRAEFIVEAINVALRECHSEECSK